MSEYCPKCYRDFVTETIRGELSDLTAVEITVRYCPECPRTAVVEFTRCYRKPGDNYEHRMTTAITKLEATTTTDDYEYLEEQR